MIREDGSQDISEYEKIELRSNEVQEILSRPPKWIVRWGIAIIFSVVLVIIIGSRFFKYPDIISAKIILTTENPPAPVVAKTSGRIQSLLVSDNEWVKKEQVVGVIENPGKYESIQQLNKILKKYASDFRLGERFKLNELELYLGEIQAYYANFYKLLDEYNQTISLDYHHKKIEQYKKELVKYDEYLQNLMLQQKILNQEYELTNKQYLRDSTLYSKELMSESDYEKSKTGLLTKSYNYQQNKISITNVEIQIETLKQNILELKLQQELQITEIVNRLRESHKNLMYAVENWNHKYVLKAPTEGVVTFNKFWNENQNVITGETVMTIIPEYEGEIIGKVQLNFQGAGKVKIGQDVNIQFASYPYMEFGMVKGVVRSISLAPSNESYTAEVELPNGLITFYDEKLSFKQEMQGKAEIITDEKSLLERIVRPLRYILNRNTNLGEIKK